MSPEERGIEVDDSIGELPNQSDTLLWAEEIVEDHYAVELGDLFAETTVHWTTTICPDNGYPAVIHEGRCYYGLTWSCQEMYVAKMKNPLCLSALIHEFGHCLLQEMGKDIDAKHEDDEFWGLMIQARDDVCREGW